MPAPQAPIIVFLVVLCPVSLLIAGAFLERCQDGNRNRPER
jgi:hypothetical protein